MEAFKQLAFSTSTLAVRDLACFGEAFSRHCQLSGHFAVWRRFDRFALFVSQIVVKNVIPRCFVCHACFHFQLFFNRWLNCFRWFYIRTKCEMCQQLF